MRYFKNIISNDRAETRNGYKRFSPINHRLLTNINDFQIESYTFFFFLFFSVLVGISCISLVHLFLARF